MAVDPFSTIAPLAAFILVLVALFTILLKTEIFTDNKIVIALVSVIVALFFASAANSFKYLKTIIPVFAVLVVILVLLLAMAAFTGADSIYKPLGIIFVVIAGIIFLVAAIFTFSESFLGYFPGQTFGHGLSSETVQTLGFLYSPKVGSSILLTIVAAVVTWLMVKS